MSDTPYKRSEPPLTFEAPAPAKLSSPAGLYSAPFAAALRSQDTAFGSRRIVHATHGGGSGEWLAASVPIDDAAQNQPADVWRVIGRHRFELAPGQAIEGRALSIPSGPVVVYKASLGEWAFAAAGGTARWTLAHDNGPDTAETVIERELPASVLVDQLEPQGAGQAWLDLQHHYMPPARPVGADANPAGAAKWSEPHTITITHEHRGAVRMIAANLAEVPVEHVVPHDTDATTLHDYAITQGQPHPDAYPQESSADGVTYEERRNGTRRGLEVAERQRTHHVPGPIAWSSYAERTTEVADTEADPVTITTTNYSRISTPVDTTQTLWDPSASGWDLIGHFGARAPENLATRVTTVRSVPVIARVYARFTSTGPQVGRVAWASSARSVISVEIDAASTSWAWWSVRGWLEATASPDDPYPVLQYFAGVSSGTLEIRAWSVAFGDFAGGVF
jgi:hypothetical protein